MEHEKQSLSLLLKQWAVNDMRFHTSSYNNGKPVPKEKDFEKLCRRPLISIWEFLLKQTKGSKQVRLVKDNLALQRANGNGTGRRKQGEESGDEYKLLRRRKRELETEIVSAVDDVAALEKTIQTKQVSELLESTAQSYEKAVENVRNLQRKKSLLTTACHRADEKVAEITEYGNRLDGLADAVNTKRKEQEMNNYFNSGVQDSNVELETESCRDVRLVCEDIGQYLHQVSTDSTLVSGDDRQAAKQNVLEKVSDLHACYSIPTLVDSLTAHTVSCAKRLREDTVRVNIASEIQDLSFSMDKKGHVRDESKPPSMKRSLQKLLQTSHQEHVMRWTEQQKYLCESWKIEAQLDDMRGEIHKLVVKAMGGNPAVVHQAEAYADLLLRLASEKAVASCLKQEVQTLSHRITQGKASHQELQTKFTQIQEFKKIVENKQHILGSLARYNTGAPSRLDKQKEVCQTYSTLRSVNSHLDLVHKMTSDMFGSLEKEVVKFHPVPFVCFLSIPLNSVRSCALDVSIAPSIIPGGSLGCLPTYAMLCQALNFPGYKSPDQMLSHILQLQNSIQQSQQTLVKMESDRSAMCRKAGVEDDPQQHRDLTNRSREHDQRLCDSSLPRLSRLENSLKWARKPMADVAIHLEAWWEQPAQNTTPWVVVEGLTFDQWMQRFNVIISQLSKKQSERQK